MSESGFRDFQRSLAPSVGYGVVIGLGAFFAVLMVGISRLQKRMTSFNPDDAAEFIAASRSVKPGLICCGIVSAWTWSATLLQSSAVVYQVGLSAAYWYGVGGTIQIIFFAAIAAKVKQNANGAVTFLQIVKARYGTPCFILFTFYALACAHIVIGSLTLGASATINALTGANIYACNMLLPIGIAAYVLAGGLRATFLVDFLHTAILFVILFIFVFNVYGTSELIGSPGKLWEMLQEAAVTHPVAGNVEGSYTTMKSNNGIIFLGTTLASGFAGVFCDQGYWQRAIASQPQSTTKAYMLGGVSWFAIPWAFGTVMGLSCRALLTSVKFPTYPYVLSDVQVGGGLVAPAAAVTLLGTGGAVAILLVVFMAATSAASAELIAVSSIVTFDILGFVWKPLRGRQAVMVSHIAIAVFAVWAGIWSIILHVASIDLGWLFYVQGVLLTPAVVPIALTVLWRKQSKHAAFWGTMVGTTTGLAGWLVGCQKIYGSISVRTLALPLAALSGASPALVLSSITTLTISLLYPDNYDWATTRAINVTEDSTITDADNPNEPATEDKSDEKHLPATTVQVASADVESVPSSPYEAALDNKVLQRVFVRASWFSSALALVIAIIIPMPMFAAHYVFSRRFFEGWVAISIAWLLVAGCLCVLLPLWESRVGLRLLAGRIVRLVK